MSKNIKRKERIKEARTQAGASTGYAPKLSRQRRWAFRIAAAVVLPLVVLGLSELGLRVAGFGYPTRFFLTKRVQGRQVLVENDRFGLRFFPPELARSPSPLVMAGEKPTGVRRIFILGESAALGDPEPAFGFGRYLQVLLEQRFVKSRFEVICTAMTAINSHAILPIARECAHQRGDVWVLYMGNNEFVGPFGPSTVFGPQAPPLSLIRFNLALKQTRLGQLVSQFTMKPAEQHGWGGMKMFLDHQVPPDDPRKEKVYQYFESNLEDILHSARGTGAKVVLSTVACNLKDCPPFASRLSDKLTERQKSDWQQLYQAAIQAQSAGGFEAAISNYQAAAQIDHSFAELQFRWAQCFLGLTNTDQAKQHFELARDFDTLPFRVDRRLNETIAKTAGKHSAQDVCLVDAASILAEQCVQGIIGREMVYEHVHLNFEGNYRLARAVAEGVARLLSATDGSPDAGGWASFEECSQRLALTDWDRRRVYQSLLRRLAEPPFVNQMDHGAQLESLRRDLVDVRAHQTPEAMARARVVYAEATGAAPEDFYLRADFAKFEEDLGNFSGAIRQWQAARDQIPFVPAPHFYLGKDLARAGKTEEALEELTAALAIRPDLPEVLEEKGRLLTTTKRTEEGLKLLERAARLEPGNARICVDRAEALAAENRHAEALDQLTRAVSLQPGFWEARYLLGVEFALTGQNRAAAEQFAETVRLNPNYVPGHLNLGIMLVKLSKIDEATAQFEETLRLDPKNQKAGEYLQALRASQQPKRKGG